MREDRFFRARGCSNRQYRGRIGGSLHRLGARSQSLGLVLVTMSASIDQSQKWFDIRDGVRAALLEHPRQEDMFWFSYEVTALPEAREPVYAPHFWRDVFEVENEWCGRIRAFAGKVQPSTRGERVWLRGFGPYRVEPPQPWSWVKRLWSRLRRLS